MWSPLEREEVPLSHLLEIAIKYQKWKAYDYVRETCLVTFINNG